MEEISFIKKCPTSVMAEHRGIRVFILISSLLTWGLTKKKVYIYTIY